jgi:hypothetical protein
VLKLSTCKVLIGSFLRCNFGATWLVLASSRTINSSFSISPFFATRPVGRDWLDDEIIRVEQKPASQHNNTPKIMDVEQELSPLIGGKTVADDINPDFKPIPKNSWYFAGEILQLSSFPPFFPFVPI